jgi:hypothetical protein
MRSCLSYFCLLFCTAASYSAHSQTATSQTPSPSTFSQQAEAAVSGGKSFSVVNLTATAEWTAGSLHELGTAQLTANADGSTSVQLDLGKASRKEAQTKIDGSRTCSWADGTGISHVIRGSNCFIAIPWYAPNLFTQATSGLPASLRTTDHGIVSRQNVTLHQISYFLQPNGVESSSSNSITTLSTVDVFYDPKTLLPASLEYSIHSDNDDSKNIPVSVVFSNYQAVSGVMLPFRIEKSVNHTLQLKLDVSNASVE